MRSTTLISLAAIALAAGCQQQERPRQGVGPHMEADSDAMPPGWVIASFNREFPEATATKIRKVKLADGTEHRQVQYRAKDGQSGSAEFDRDGKLVPQR